MNIKLGLIVLTLVWAMPGMAADETINKKSPYSVAKTLDRLENIVKNKGITVFARVDHGAGAKKVGKDLHASELLIFGNPKMGSPLMQEAPIMGLELPMKALAWEDASGQVWLSYLKPEILQQRHQLKNSVIINKMTRALDAMTQQAVD
ncbi:MAG: DUF302 domain-containing protein [Gammaproteobacteria bacterium]|nr:DUF302 domain-containing protein [Gammaproteobacteria bacterium]